MDQTSILDGAPIGTPPSSQPGAQPSVGTAAIPTSAPKKSNVWVFVAVGCGVLLLLCGGVVAAIFGLGIWGANSAKKVVDEYQTKVDAVKKSNDSAVVKGLNQEHEAGGLKINIVEAKVYNTNDKYTQPDAGNAYVALKVEIKNESSDSVFVSSTDFSISNADGVAYTQIYYKEKEPSLVGKSLSKGETLTGYITYEVSDSDSKLEVKFSSMRLEGEYIRKWQLDNPAK
jgi:hypothetical protein